MMKYLLPVFIVALLATGCKNNCYECSWKVEPNKPATPRLQKDYCDRRDSKIPDLEKEMRTRGYDDFKCKKK